MESKMITKEQFKILRSKFREEKKTVVLCHGVFDLLHYGHIEHLQEAKQQGDILVVSVTASRYVNKGPGRPYFNDQQRLAFLANLEMVDYVLLSEAVTVHEIVSCVQPCVYVKGQEYSLEKNDITGNIRSEREIVEKYGGKIYFTQGAIYSSTKLLNKFFEALPSEVIEESGKLREKYGRDLENTIRTAVDDFSNLKILVVGDIIIDDYVFCKIQGVTSKDSVISTRYDFKERYAGGSLAIARHLAQFSDHVTCLSIIGEENGMKEEIVSIMDNNIHCEFIEEPHFITPVKMRFLKRHPQRQEYDKLFSMNKLLDTKDIKNVNYQKFYQKLDAIINQYDLVIVCDYGHGTLNEKSIRTIENKAKFLSVNCQTNSSNYGMNLITKYHRADCFVVDTRELLLAFSQERIELSELLEALSKQMESSYAWVTLGSDGAIGLSENEKSHLSAVTLHVKDTVGAGDAFYALASLAAVSKVPIDIATLLSNVAGGIKTNLVGNSKAVGKVDLLKFINTILNV